MSQAPTARFVAAINRLSDLFAPRHLCPEADGSRLAVSPAGRSPVRKKPALSRVRHLVRIMLSLPWVSPTRQGDWPFSCCTSLNLDTWG